MTDINIQDITKALNKKFGKETVLFEPLKIDFVVPTGSIMLDIATGIGGFPGGRMVEIFGRESGGKSTLSLSMCRNVQRMGFIPTYVDVEHSFDRLYAESLGVDPNQLILVQPDSAEGAMEVIEESIALGSKLAILDSVGALVPKREMIGEAEIGDSVMGVLPKLMSQFTRRITPLLAEKQALVVFTNQMRAKIGGMGPVQEDTPGGYALKHNTSVRVKLARTGTNTTDDEASSINVVAKVVKNKVAPPYLEANYMIEFGTGINNMAEVVNLMLANGIIVKSGAWYKDSNGAVIGQGMDKTIGYIGENRTLISQVMELYPMVNYNVYFPVI